jgi:hypothetical protein
LLLGVVAFFGPKRQRWYRIREFCISNASFGVMLPEQLKINLRRFVVRKLVVLFALAVLSLQAGVVYDNGGPDGVDGSEMTAWIQAEDFLLGAPTSLTNVSFWSMEADVAYQGSIFWQIYSDDAGNPGTVLFSGTATPTRTAAPEATAWGYPIGMRNDFSVGPIALLGGTTYWLGLHNGPLATTYRWDFYWATADANTTQTGRNELGPFGYGGLGGWRLPARIQPV